MSRQRLPRTLGIAAVILALIGGAVFGIQRLTTKRSVVRYTTRPVGYADISAAVSETGTVNPVDQIQVGSQVSGTIATLNVDYNSKVRKGEVLAIIDPTTFQAAVAQAAASLQATQATAAAGRSSVLQAQASLAGASASLQQAQANLRSTQAAASKAQAQLALDNLTVQRDASLLQQGYIPQNQMDTDRTTAAAGAEDFRAAQAAVGVAQAQAIAAAAQVRSAQAAVVTAQAQAAALQHQVQAASDALAQAQYNLSRTVITSPVDGIVMARNISVGQTVAASFQTPTLFTIATNLTNMEVDTSVDEADVGQVRPGQTAHITVTAFPNTAFSGTIQQVRVNPTIVQNVVTYDAVVIVHDTSGRLLPGMTAQVTINVGQRTHVLAVPTAALLYRPLQPGGAQAPAGGAPTGGTPPSAPVAGAPGSQVTVWVLRNGRPAAAPIVIGASDGQNFEVVSGDLHEGDRVIIAQARGPARTGAGIAGPGGGPGGAGR